MAAPPPDPVAAGRDVDVSFAVACYDCREFLEDAVASALAQRAVSVEVLIVDDGSRDGSRELAAELARRDERVHLHATPRNGGPGAARNIALAVARGRWFAVLDSDDLLAPDRSRALIDAADAAAADMIADDLVLFGEGLAEARFLGGGWPQPAWLPLDRYLRDSAMFGAAPNPGFLKPMIRRDFLVRTGITYDEQLRIAEDDDLVVRLLLAGAAYRVVPEPGYRYRKHAASISHRLSRDHADRMAAAAARLRPQVIAAGADGPAFRLRERALADAVAFTHAIDALKQRRPFAAARAALRRPTSLRLFAMPIRARLARMFGTTQN